MPRETITAQARSDLKVSKTSKRSYFIITDNTQRKLICYNPHLWDLFNLGSTIDDVEIQAGKTEDDLPRIVSVGGQPKPGAEPIPPSREKAKYGRDEDSYRKERRSIERQVSVKLACEISAEADNLEAILNKAEEIYQWISKIG